MDRTAVPRTLGALGYAAADVPALTKATLAQQRLLGNAPREVAEADIDSIFRSAL